MTFLKQKQQRIKSDRKDYLDVVCGIMISWMILGHIIANCDLKESMFYTIGNRLFPFFMPWFFFKSGMFYKQKDSIRVLKRGAKIIITLGVFLHYINFDSVISKNCRSWTWVLF